MSSPFRRCVIAVFVAVFSLALAVPGGAVYSNTPDDTWGANGRVYSILEIQNRIYIAGNFTAVVSPTGQSVPRQHLAAFDATTGALDASWTPQANGSVHALAASSDGSTVFAGGAFTTIDGATHNRLAAVDAATGTAVAGWDTGANFPVWDLTVSGSRLYLGGSFTRVAGAARKRLAAVDADSGSVVSSWRPSANATVKALEMSSDGSLLFAGGKFTSISGVGRLWIAGLDPSTGSVSETWRGDVFGDISPCGNGCVLDIDATADSVFVAVGGVAGGNRAAALDADTGQLRWRKLGNGDVQAVAFQSGLVYIGGHFNFIANRTRERFLVVNARTGLVRNDFVPRFNSAMGVWSILPDGDRLYVGGDFTTVSGVAQPRLARFTDGASAP